MAGGTGGHVFPALAVAAVLRARGWQVDWLGTRRGIEAQLVPQAGIDLHYIAVAGLRGKGARAWLQAPWRLLRALGQALAIVRRVRPHVVLGLGGFASGPGGVAARLLGKPLVIHEQNAVAGTTNKILARIASRTLQAFPGSLPRGVVTGNPVRGEIAALAPPQQRYDARADNGAGGNLLVLGGSLGALAINDLVPAAVNLLAPAARPHIRHQTGARHLQQTKARYRELAVEADIEPFIDDMAAALAWADLVIARAGALTVAELTAAGVAAVLVPFPFAIDDHQTKNAEWLAQQGAAVVKPQHELDASSLSLLLQELTGDRPRLKNMAVRARDLALPEAANQVADVCGEVANG
ncbi:undecaprenyldiphospho-muramoylpentapeptide beta-N-acetylglucosaminyltransferase [Exilibacterium tricleocarpae]|uniref:UDP-N-acetylglucosamine--N-acetylmuramyl-(pentapeptide) pyrophosphoryl-undecaprenol N-acetylglucosamine transferase n=2 Tax=Exilibacterium tricleocarpae TaxID=2591008 RepID=A0A545TQK6_9GAMM|nr:undecaprenyldiphospho-muramoylpentapeptide beta-N-acetylglucosaminyltransferase [Exilibacterium tricleocarpae]